MHPPIVSHFECGLPVAFLTNDNGVALIEEIQLCDVNKVGLFQGSKLAREFGKGFLRTLRSGRTCLCPQPVENP